MATYPTRKAGARGKATTHARKQIRAVKYGTPMSRSTRRNAR